MVSLASTIHMYTMYINGNHSTNYNYMYGIQYKDMKIWPQIEVGEIFLWGRLGGPAGPLRARNN